MAENYDELLLGELDAMDWSVTRRAGRAIRALQAENEKAKADPARVTAERDTHRQDSYDLSVALGEWALEFGTIEQARAQLAALAQERDEAREDAGRRQAFMERAGYRRCDIPACNCDSWHGGAANERLAELRKEIGEDGKTLLQSAHDLRAQLATLAPRAEAMSLIERASDMDYVALERGGPASRAPHFARPWHVLIGSGPQESRREGMAPDLASAIRAAVGKAGG